MILSKDELEIRRLCNKFNIRPPYGDTPVVDTFRDLVERTCEMLERTEQLEKHVMEMMDDIRRLKYE